MQSCAPSLLCGWVYFINRVCAAGCSMGCSPGDAATAWPNSARHPQYARHPQTPPHKAKPRLANQPGSSCLVARTRFELVISALRGRRPKPLDERAIMAGMEGVEPPLTEPESAVLPLDDIPVAALAASTACKQIYYGTAPPSARGEFRRILYHTPCGSFKPPPVEPLRQ